MNFKRVEIKKANTRRKPSTKYVRTSSKNTKSKNVVKRKKTRKIKIWKIILYIFLFFIVLGIILSFVLYFKFIKDLPSVSELENLNIAESSVIYDRNGNVLYNIYEEKRTYIEYEEIGQNMINALVAGEDKRYWDNPGFDVIGLARAFITGLMGENDGFGGTSTITQQLIRNTIIENRSSSESTLEKIERKIKELYLAYKLTNDVSKEKILELYLNKIGFGSNAHGIEQAAKTFFNKSAKDLNILEASILASIPKGPTYYSPYTHPDRLVGYSYVYKIDDENDKTEIISQKDLEGHAEDIQVLKDFITNLKGSGVGTVGTDRAVICGVNKNDFKINFNIDDKGCLVIKYNELLNFLNGIKLQNNNNYIEYQTGRKDFILQRMLEDGYINFEEYKEAIINSIAFVFNQALENIEAPHFVFYVKEYLEEKYGEGIISVGGFQIYTSLDPDLQAKAEELIKKQVETNTTGFNATNAALISIDNKNGDILAMVGGVNYFDQENKGNVNIITSPLQPGSAFKPFVYALGIYNNQIGTKTPIYDLETTFPGNYTPKNFEGSFLGKINISTALNHSRNIPAIKMFYMAGGEENVVNFMKKLGTNSLQNHGQYGAPLALGTGEMTPLELASAYSVFANLGDKIEINPILKIVDSKGNIIEEKSGGKIEENVISNAQSYIINSILSDTTTRPSSRNGYLTISGRPVAAKTGTSTKQFEKNGAKQIYPANLWTAGYTPQITTVVWAGNTDGSQVGMRGDGLNGAGPVWRDFMTYAHKDKAVENWTKPSSVYQINISEISGLLPNPEKSSSNLTVSSLFVNKPTKYDNSYQTVQIDVLCNGAVGPNTPPAAIKTATLIEFHSLNPDNAAWEKSVQEWAKSPEAKEKYGNVHNLVTSVSTEPCERGSGIGNVTIGSNLINNGSYNIGENYLEIGYKSDNPINSIEILINGEVTQTIDTGGKKEGVYIGNLFIASPYRNKTLTIEIRVVDNEYYSKSETTTIIIGAKDEVPPTIELINPSSGSIKLYEGDYFNLKANVSDASQVEIMLYIDGAEYAALGNVKRIEIPINNEKDLEVGNHTIKIKATDIQGNSSEKDISLEVLRR